MTTLLPHPETQIEQCRHDPMAVCWLCSDQVSWWRDARIKAGLGELPPNAPIARETPPEVRRRRFMQRKWSRAYYARRRAGVA